MRQHQDAPRRPAFLRSVKRAPLFTDRTKFEWISAKHVEPSVPIQSQLKQRNKSMFTSIIVFAAAVALVATYIFIVNRFLRSDENWNENSQLVAAEIRPRVAVPQTRRPSVLTPNHA